MIESREQLYSRGLNHIVNWCNANAVLAPTVCRSDEPKQFDTCAYYRDDVITICVEACAVVGTVGRAWSYPGYVVDRTPYGVLAHELAHHVDKAHGASGGIYGQRFYRETREEAITSYAPNVNEWFAEMFRLFVTNPSLLANIRPKTFALLDSHWQRIEDRDWTQVLVGAERQLNAALNKIKQATRPRKAVSGRLF